MIGSPIRDIRDPSEKRKIVGGVASLGVPIDSTDENETCQTAPISG